MSEINRLSSLLEKLYNGEPWIDVNITGTLSAFSAEQAVAKPNAGVNSIWEIVNHMIEWRKNVLKRLNGKLLKTPAHNYFLPIINRKQADWKSTLKKFEKSQKDWLHYLENMKSSDLGRIYAPNQMTYYEHIAGIIQHDAYHLGQIRILVSLLKGSGQLPKKISG